MTGTVWKKLWLLALVANDIDPTEADEAFNFLYTTQPVDLNKDPIADALILVSQCCAA